MSLQFSEDPRSKREKQEIFKQSLDDQRRMQQEASLASSKPDPGHGQFVPGLDGVASGMNRIPGLEHHQQGGGGAAPRFEGSASPQEKQPYMSAVSDMYAIQTYQVLPTNAYVTWENVDSWSVPCVVGHSCGALFFLLCDLRVWCSFPSFCTSYSCV